MLLKSSESTKFLYVILTLCLSKAIKKLGVPMLIVLHRLDYDEKVSILGINARFRNKYTDILKTQSPNPF